MFVSYRPMAEILVSATTPRGHHSQAASLYSISDHFAPVSIFINPNTFLVPRARLAIMQRRAFSIVGPSAWNDLPFELRSVLMAHPSKFYISLKSFFFVRGWAGSASE